MIDMTGRDGGRFSSLAMGEVALAPTGPCEISQNLVGGGTSQNFILSSNIKSPQPLI